VIGRQVAGGRAHGPIALGCARWALAAEPDLKLVTATVRAAVDGGVTVFDTARAYSPPSRPGYGERLLARALGRDLDEVLVVTKGGHWREADGSFRIDGRPETLAHHVDESLSALGVEAIGLYLLHRPDPQVPLRESLGKLRQLQEQGKLRAVGVCNVTAEALTEVLEDLPPDAVQNRCAYVDGAIDPVLELCRRAGVAYLAYSPLGGPTGARAADEHRSALSQVAAVHGCTPQQVALAWLLAQGDHVVAVSGAGRPATVRQSVRAAAIELGPDDLARLDGARVSAGSG
jgi:aryl-alcohol dehydrogenase-like predicted oxidoreductase